MDKNKIEKFCEKVGFGIAIGLILTFIIFFNISNIAFGEIILYDVLPNYKINEDIKDFFKDDETILASNISNLESEEIGEIEIIGIEDISYEHEKTEEQVKQSIQTTYSIDINSLRDLDYLKQNFYIVDASTGISKDYFDVDKFMAVDLKIEKNSEEPKVLVFHTHANEMFIDSNTNDLNEGVVGAGTRLCNILEEEYGIKTLHVTDVFDMVDGKVDRNGAYERMEPVIKKVLEQNPSIELVIDLHRDGVAETTHLVEDINGKPTAKIMFFNGISRILKDGKLNDVTNLPNPYVETNLALSFNMQLAAMEKYPSFTRKIYIKSYRYSLHLKPKTLLIEAGAQTNTKQEIYNAMELLADLINDVIFS